MRLQKLSMLLWLAAAPVQAESLRVLFVGNSYTYVNELPVLVAAMARTQGVSMQVAMRAEPDYSLADHLKSRKLKIALSEPWDWIVLQQGPSSLPDSRAELIASTRELAQRLRRAQEWRRRQAMGLGPLGGAPQSASARVVGPPSEALRRTARIALFAAWPQLPYADGSPAAEESYRQAAQAVRACVLPVAAAWRLAREAGDAPRLYQPDAIHPTRAGTILAALTIVTGLLELEAVPPLVAPDATDGEKLARLQASARLALEQEPQRCGGVPPSRPSPARGGRSE